MYNEYEEYSLKTKMDFKVWKRIFKEILKYPGYLIGAIISMLASTFCETMFIKYICSDGLAKYMKEGITSSFFAFVVGMIMFIVALGLSTASFLRFAGILELKFYKGLTKKTFAKVQDQPFSFFDRSSVGWLMARISSDTSRLGEIISWGLIDIIYAIFKLVFIFIIMWTINFKLSLIMLIIIPVVCIAATLFNNLIIRLSRKQRRINSEITSALNEGISGAKTSKTLVLEEKNIKEFSNTVNKYKSVTVKISWTQSAFYQIIAFSSALALALMGYFNSYFFISIYNVRKLFNILIF